MLVQVQLRNYHLAITICDQFIRSQGRPREMWEQYIMEDK